MTDILAAVRWWAALAVVGLAAWPLVYTLMRRLPDRGFALARPAGLLLVGYVFWMAGSLGFAGNDGGGILLALLAAVALSWLAYRRRPESDPTITEWLRANRRTVIVTELLFVVVFALWAWVRAQNPAISATEKPMEFAFLTGVGRSPTFPPLDPWLSGYAISYYYFGYVMVSLLGQMAFVAEPLAFNLAIAWIVAGTATGAFGVVYNLIALRDTRYEIRDTSEAAPLLPRSPAPLLPNPASRHAILFGLIAALAIPIAGNLQMGLELLHGNGIGPDALWAWLDVRDVNGPAIDTETPRYETTGWWWWRTSRVIHEYHLTGRAEEGLEPIVEIPAFSFVLGDLHPHVLALPFALLAVAVALAWWLELRPVTFALRAKGRKGEGEKGGKGGHPVSPSPLLPFSLSALPNKPLWLFTALLLGGLSFLNTWDVAIYLFLVVGAWFTAQWFLNGTTRGLWGRAAVVGALLVVPAALLYLPFYLGFRSQAGPPFLLPFLMRPTRLFHFLIIFGMPLLVITVTLLTLAARQRFRHWKTGLAAAVALVGGLLLIMLLFILIIAAGPDNGRLFNLASELGVSFTGLFGVILGARLASPWLVLFLAGLVALVVMVLRTWVEEENPQISQIEEEEDPQISQITQIKERDWETEDTAESEETGENSDNLRNLRNLRIKDSFDVDTLGEVEVAVDADWGTRATPFVLLLVLTGVLLTLGPEFLYLRDNFGVRLNTTFKFYYQAWVMFGVAAVFGLDYLWATRRSAVSRVVAPLTTAVYLALLVVALLFPVYAVRSRAAEYRGPALAADGTPQERQPATLDGLAYLNRYNPSEYEAIQWLRQRADESATPPVVLEAVGGQYSSFGRVSANTGLPTLLGWPGHEWQWRGSDHPEPGRRESIVEQIYTAPDLSMVAFLLDEFDVAYIYVGDLEREKYGPVGLEKFAERLSVAFANDRVTIYRWQSAAQ